MSTDSDPSDDDSAPATAPHTSSSSKHNKIPTVKRTVKYLAICNSPHAAVRECIRASPDSVVKCICNAAYNVERGEVVLSPKHNALFGKHRKLIAKLTSRAGSLQTKRKVLQSQKGGFIIPALIRIAVAAFGDQRFTAIEDVIVS